MHVLNGKLCRILILVCAFIAGTTRADAMSHKIFTGDFNGDGRTDTAFYYGGNGDFWIGLSNGSTLSWTNAGNIASFGDLLDGRAQFFTGDFNGDGKTDLMFATSLDSNWWVGLSDGKKFNWHMGGNTKLLGNVFGTDHFIRLGDFNGDRKTDILIYYSGDHNWWLGTSDGQTFSWQIVANTVGFQSMLDEWHQVFFGDFNGDGRTDAAFYYNGDGNWWIGLSNGKRLDWHLASNSGNFGSLLDSAHTIDVVDINGDGKDDIVFYFNGDGSYWTGISNGWELTWNLALKAPQLGSMNDYSHRSYYGDFNGDGRQDLLAYSGLDGTFDVGLSNGQQFVLQTPIDISGFKNLMDSTRQTFVGKFRDSSKDSFLFGFSGDGNWWQGTYNGIQFDWVNFSNTQLFGDILH